MCDTNSYWFGVSVKLSATTSCARTFWRGSIHIPPGTSLSPSPSAFLLTRLPNLGNYRRSYSAGVWSQQSTAYHYTPADSCVGVIELLITTNWIIYFPVFSFALGFPFNVRLFLYLSLLPLFDGSHEIISMQWGTVKLLQKEKGKWNNRYDLIPSSLLFQSSQNTRKNNGKLRGRRRVLHITVV